MCLDILRPRKINVNQGKRIFRTLICIDLIINYPDIVVVQNAISATEVVFVDKWLQHYFCPRCYLHNNRNEFLLSDFRQMIERNNIQPITATGKNPEANAIVERMHQSINIMLAISWQEHLPKILEHTSQVIESKCNPREELIDKDSLRENSVRGLFIKMWNIWRKNLKRELIEVNLSNRFYLKDPEKESKYIQMEQLPYSGTNIMKKLIFED